MNLAQLISTDATFNTNYTIRLLNILASEFCLSKPAIDTVI